MDQEWLMLNIMLPQKPSAVRVSTWRKLKAIGAANIGQSAWVLPYSQPHYDNFKEIAIIVDSNEGRAFIIKSHFLQTPENKPLQDYFNDDRNIEYKELLEHCDFFLHEIKRETEKVNFTFAELEENEQELEKLESWFRKIEIRDFFECSLKTNAIILLQECRVRLQEFSENVYANNNDNLGSDNYV